MDAIDRFLVCAGDNPSHTAVASGASAVTYQQLEDRVRRIGTVVASLPTPVTLIALPQGADAYAAMLGAGMGGGCYVPINVGAPPDKLQRIVSQLRPSLILSARQYEPLLAEMGAIDSTVIYLDELDTPPLCGRGSRHRIAYIIFTSGSTGMPKGVVISRDAFDHYVGWIGTALSITPQDRVTQHPNISFDLSVLDIYGALCYGATLLPLLGKGDRLLPARFVARERATVWISVPSVVGLMIRARQAEPANLRSLRLFAFCGEPLLSEHLQAIFAATPHATVLNTYGPTEATVSVTEICLTAANYRAACIETVAIGAPIAGMTLVLAGGADDDEGEIVIMGPQLADGYWNNPEQTEKAFRPAGHDGRAARAYFTGDWAQRRGGYLFCRGRIDNQVKLMGYRLELDEVSAAIRRCGWPNVCVLEWRDGLAAVIEMPDSSIFDEGKLRQDLAKFLEAHALPAIIRQLSTLPRNANDKIDTRAIASWLDAAGSGAQDIQVTN